ncbi:hypothetical protein F0L68_21545 [Solihabitans fulvus]|uniref:DUF6879 domain-containing protein n=1 Tax=Solihabitans fulvus TaxID=1892852 RepID=A0A5B2X8B7_9PSEU|nr:DUF6879 family protein [Solihabitans fulvus]KAA2259514.1 hypothetical protein F0L68_21545 [Solihabitans fulvus]
MLERVHEAPGEIFNGSDGYNVDVSQYWGRISRFDKLERRQHFREPDNPSWEAFALGHWTEALRLHERARSAVEAEFAEDARRGMVSRRVRVVGQPVTPYLQWELHGLMLRAEHGESIRVVTPESLDRFALDDSLPELIFLGELAMYEVLYDTNDTLYGARKFTDRELIAGCLVDVAELHSQGEDLRTFFQREIVELPPPVVGPEVVFSRNR